MDAISTVVSLQWGALITGLGGGLSLFLFGMRMMTEALKTVAGGGMKNLLARLTTNRYTAVGLRDPNRSNLIQTIERNILER